MDQPERRASFPPYLPRAAFVGAFVNSSSVTPQVRLQWELTLIQERIDSLVLLFGGGGGYGLNRPQNLGPTNTSVMISLYQHVILGGFGFRADRPGGFHWGFQAATGPLFYGARFSDLPSERGVLGLVEGRADVGWRFGSIVYGVSFGYASLYQQPMRLQSGPYLGGIMFGLFADGRQLDL